MVKGNVKVGCLYVCMCIYTTDSFSHDAHCIVSFLVRLPDPSILVLVYPLHKSTFQLMPYFACVLMSMNVHRIIMGKQGFCKVQDIRKKKLLFTYVLKILEKCLTAMTS